MPDNPFIPNFLEGPAEDFLGFEIPTFGLDGGGATGQTQVATRKTQTGAVPSASGGNAQAVAQACQPVLPVQVVSRAQCPKGYVVVEPPGQGKQCMLKALAVKCGLYKNPAKPPIKASDWRCLKKAASVTRKLDRVVKMSNQVTGKADLRRVRSKR
jgi:hypothetical protein